MREYSVLFSERIHSSTNNGCNRAPRTTANTLHVPTIVKMAEAAADLSALTDDFGFDSGRHHGGLVNEWGTTASSLEAMRELKRSGAKGPEASSIYRELRIIRKLAEIKQEMNAWLVRLTNSTTKHPYSERIFDTFKMFRARCQDEEQLHQLQSFLSQRNRIVRFSFGSNARAAMVACIYAIFHTEDVLMQDATRERCYSLAMVSHVAGVPLRRAKKWLRALRILCSDVFARVKADAPIFYPDEGAQDNCMEASRWARVNATLLLPPCDFRAVRPTSPHPTA